MYCEWYVQEEIKGCGDILLFVCLTNLKENLYAMRTAAICDSFVECFGNELL